MAITAINPTSVATDAFGLSFQSLLQIILTQLTYQDPLKPMDNFQFVSQLGQFAQLQQTQTLNDQIDSLLTTQSSVLSFGLLGRTVDITTDQASLSGVVQALSFAGDQPSITLRTDDDQVISNLSLADVTQIR